MKLLISPQLSARQAVQKRILYEVNNAHTYQPPMRTCPHRHRPFSSTPCNLSKHEQCPPPPTQTQQKQKPDTSLSHQIRLLMRRIPHPVAIVTASSPPPSTTEHNTTSHEEKNPIPRGMTVSSFNTVTLHPSPIITFNVRQPSETLAALQSSRHFLVHLLSPTASMARLARNFSRGNVNLDLDQFEFVGHSISDQPPAGMDNIRSSLTVPRLIRRRDSREDGTKESEEDFTFILECEYLPDKSVQVYDHMIVLGNVRRIIACGAKSLNDTGGGERHSKDDFCLVYADTRFWGMGEETS